MLAKHTPPGTDRQCTACADEIDAIGTKRYESQSGGEREIQRTMLELLNQMDGFDSMGDVKVRRSASASCAEAAAACGLPCLSQLTYMQTYVRAYVPMLPPAAPRPLLFT